MLALISALAALHLAAAPAPAPARDGAPWGGTLQKASILLTGAGAAPSGGAPPTGGQYDFTTAVNSALLATL